MGGNEIDRGGELGMIDPDRPDFAGGDRHGALALHPLQKLDEIGDGLVGTVDGLVADHDCIDVAVAPRQRNSCRNFPLVAGFVLVDPDAERHLEPELGCDRRDELAAAGRAIGADRLGVGAEDFQISANLLFGGTIAVVRMLGPRVGRVGDAGQRRIDVGDRLVPLEQSP